MVRQRGKNCCQASYTHDGERYWERFNTKADADAWLAEARVKIGRGEWVNRTAGRTTVAKLASLWPKSNGRKRGSTLERDDAFLRLHVLPVLGAKRVAAVRLAADDVTPLARLSGDPRGGAARLRMAVSASGAGGAPSDA